MICRGRMFHRGKGCLTARRLLQGLGRKQGVKMEAKDIELYLKAKKEIRRAWRITQICVLALLVWIGLYFFDIRYEALNGVAVALFIVGLINGEVCSVSAFGSYSSRSRLLEVIERQINNDPAALQYLAERGS